MRRSLLVFSLILVLTFLFYVSINPADFGKSRGDHIIFGEPNYTDMDDYFIQNAQKEVAANNVVTSIVFDYRGFDTLGEASVLFTAVLGVGMVLRKLKKGE